MPDRPDFEPEPDLLAGRIPQPKEEETLPSFLNRMTDAIDAQNQTPQAEEEETEEAEFSPEIAQEVTGLLHLGRLTGRFEVLGHTFVLQTLKVGEELAVGQMVNDYAQTVVQGQAFAAALVAASLVSVDGRPILQQLGPDQEASIRDKFEYITTRWYSDTVLEIYAAYKELQARQVRAYEAVQGKSKASRDTSTP